VCLIITGAAHAETYRIPEDEPIARVTIDSDWKTKAKEEFIEATTPDGTGHVIVLPVEHRKIGEAMNEAMRYIRRTGTVRVKADTERRTTDQVNGRAVRIFSWDATDAGKPLRIHCHVVSIVEGKPLLVVYWGSPEAEHKHASSVRNMLQRLEQP